MNTEHAHVIERKPHGGYWILPGAYATFASAQEARNLLQQGYNARGERRSLGVASCSCLCCAPPAEPTP